MNIIDSQRKKRIAGKHVHFPNSFQRWDARVCLPRHRHVEPYATVIVSGGFYESGSSGRYLVRPGDVLFHRPFDAHLNEIFATGAEVVHLLLTEPESRFGLWRLTDLDAFVRLAKQDIPDALLMLMQECMPMQNLSREWPDSLATELHRDPNLSLENWVSAHNLSFDEACHDFRAAHGVTLSAFRDEIRARKVLAQLASGVPFLDEICQAAGFPNRRDMYRAVKELTGNAPFHLLRQMARGRSTTFGYEGNSCLAPASS